MNKITAPVIVSVCLIGYYTAGGILIIKLNFPVVVKAVALIVSITITMVIVVVLGERIKEIKGGEEDDLGKY